MGVVEGGGAKKIGAPTVLQCSMFQITMESNVIPVLRISFSKSEVRGSR